jgi:hypothetical protein
MPVSRACRAVNLGRSCYYRTPQDLAARDAPVIARLNEVVGKHGRWGFWKCFHWLRLKGETWNHKRVWRVYRSMKLNLPRRAKRRLPARVRTPPYESWGWFFGLSVFNEGGFAASRLEIGRLFSSVSVVLSALVRILLRPFPIR